MSRKKRIVSYHDEKRIDNGTTTIMYGKTEILARGKTRVDVEELAQRCRELTYGGSLVARGVAKLHADDKYDSKTGKIVASKKAELVGLKKAHKYLDKVLENLEAVRNDVLEELAKVKYRKETLMKDKH